MQLPTPLSPLSSWHRASKVAKAVATAQLRAPASPIPCWGLTLRPPRLPGQQAHKSTRRSLGWTWICDQIQGLLRGGTASSLCFPLAPDISALHTVKGPGEGTAALAIAMCPEHPEDLCEAPSGLHGTGLNKCIGQTKGQSIEQREGGSCKMPAFPTFI